MQYALEVELDFYDFTIKHNIFIEERWIVIIMQSTFLSCNSRKNYAFQEHFAVDTILVFKPKIVQFYFAVNF